MVCVNADANVLSAVWPANQKGIADMISAVVLAAGESKRMGKPKLLLPLGRSTILVHTIDNLLSSRVSEVVIVVGYQADEVIKTIASRPVKIAINPAYRQGMSTSMIAGLNLVDDMASAVMLVLADQPFIDSGTVDRLIEEFYNHDKGIAIPVCQGRRGHPIIFAVKYKEELLRVSGDVGGRPVIMQHPDDILEVAVDSESIITDIDTTSDYQSYLV